MCPPTHWSRCVRSHGVNQILCELKRRSPCCETSPSRSSLGKVWDQFVLHCVQQEHSSAIFLALVSKLQSLNGFCMSWWQLVKLIQSTLCRCGPRAIWTLLLSYKIQQWQYGTLILILMMQQMCLDADDSVMTKNPQAHKQSFRPATVSIT